MKLNPRQRRLVEQNLALVPPMARQVARRLPDCVTHAELESIGYEALCRCALTHRAALGPFNYWAKVKVNGAMIDANKGSKYARRFVQLPETGPEGASIDQVRVDPCPSPEQLVIDRQARQILNGRIAEALRTLSKAERQILEASDNATTLGEIAEELGVGITTVHRRRETIYAKLRLFLAKRETNRCHCETKCPDNETQRNNCEHPTFSAKTRRRC